MKRVFQQIILYSLMPVLALVYVPLMFLVLLCFLDLGSV